jgi:hypothetical protein
MEKISEKFSMSPFRQTGGRRIESRHFTLMKKTDRKESILKEQSRDCALRSAAMFFKRLNYIVEIKGCNLLRGQKKELCFSQIFFFTFGFKRS